MTWKRLDHLKPRSNKLDFAAIALPATTKDPIQLADWVEFVALLSDDGGASSGDLESALKRTGTYDINAPDDEESADHSNDELIERKVDEVFDELDNRAQAAAGAYPFEISRAEVKSKGSVEHYAPYIFCLCLSRFGDGAKRVETNEDDDGDSSETDPTYPRRLFEHIATIAAANYLGGDAVRFGWPRRGMSKSFARALDELSSIHLREGGGHNKGPVFGSKDRKVDVVAWKDFPDGKSSKLVILGQCATNKDDDWQSKKPELIPSAFWGNWMKSAAVSKLIRAFFIPHQVPLNEWDIHAREAGLFFDRCRIAHFAAMGDDSSRTHDSGDWDLCIDWANRMMATVDDNVRP